MLRAFTLMVVAMMALVLLLFTASRTYDLISQFLPPGQNVFAFLALVAFDGGLLGWSFFFAHGARGQWQRAIALLMVIVSLLSVGVSSIADMYLSSANKGLVASMPAAARLAVLLFVGLVIFANVAAFFLVHITEPGQMKVMATEAARDQIEAATLREIMKRAPGAAANIAPELADSWVRDIYQQYLRAPTPTKKLPPGEQPPPEEPGVHSKEGPFRG